jgi:hypothetical protein
MRSKKRINLGLLLLILLAVAATGYSIWQDQVRAGRVEAGIAHMRRIQEEETKALIFPEDAILDQQISEEEMAEQQASLRTVLEKLYPSDSERQSERYESVDHVLQKQATHNVFLRQLSVDWEIEPKLTYEGHLLKMEVENAYVTADIYNAGTVDNHSNYSLGTPVSYLFSLPDMTLVDQTKPLAGRFLDIFLPGGQDSDESETPWNESF